ncbi:hypothetical protein B0H11DRAFT_2317584 [Mycena galericulata]|nr:hypothetical protein B0H11DRAFT_2317584 [Mycena galericulata]
MNCRAASAIGCTTPLSGSSSGLRKWVETGGGGDQTVRTQGEEESFGRERNQKSAVTVSQVPKSRSTAFVFSAASVSMPWHRGKLPAPTSSSPSSERRVPAQQRGGANADDIAGPASAGAGLACRRLMCQVGPCAVLLEGTRRTRTSSAMSASQRFRPQLREGLPASEIELLKRTGPTRAPPFRSRKKGRVARGEGALEDLGVFPRTGMRPIAKLCVYGEGSDPDSWLGPGIPGAEKLAEAGVGEVATQRDDWEAAADDSYDSVEAGTGIHHSDSLGEVRVNETASILGRF